MKSLRVRIIAGAILYLIATVFAYTGFLSAMHRAHAAEALLTQRSKEAQTAWPAIQAAEPELAKKYEPVRAYYASAAQKNLDMLNFQRDAIGTLCGIMILYFPALAVLIGLMAFAVRCLRSRPLPIYDDGEQGA